MRLTRVRHDAVERVPARYDVPRCPHCHALLWVQSSNGTLYDDCTACHYHAEIQSWTPRRLGMELL